MKIFLILLVIFLCHTSLTVATIFPGPCPIVTSVPLEFECSSKIKPGSFKVVAYLPVDGDTLNMFYNNYGTINCIDFLLTCSYASSIDLQMRPNCYPTMKGNVTSGIVEQCLPITFDPRIRGGNQISSFGLGLQLICREKIVAYTTSLIFDSNGELLGIYGCRNFDDGTHDEGSWVLATSTKDLPSNPMEYLQNYLNAAANVTATTSDFQINDFSVEHSCDCKKCSYTLECPVDKEAEPPVYDYYQGVNYNDYPQYSNDYSYDYKTDDEANDKSDQPVYYYYDTPQEDSEDNHYEDNYHNEFSTTEGAPEPIEISSTIEPFDDHKLTESSNWETKIEGLATTESSFEHEIAVTEHENVVTMETEHVTENNEVVKEENLIESEIKAVTMLNDHEEKVETVTETTGI